MAVIEAHSAPGGAAHHWCRGQFSFDSGAALFSGINPLTPAQAKGPDVTTDNPLSSVLAAVGESVPGVVDMPDSATCLVYPDGKQYRCQLGSKAFVDVVEERYGGEAARQWRTFQEEVDRLCLTAGAVPPAAVRLDDGTTNTNTLTVLTTCSRSTSSVCILCGVQLASACWIATQPLERNLARLQAVLLSFARMPHHRKA